MHAKSLWFVFDSLLPYGLWPTRLLCPWDSPGKNTGVSCHFLLQLSHISHVLLFATLWTAAHQAPLSMRFSRQKYWTGCPAFLQGIFPTLGIEPTSFTVSCTGKQVFFTISASWEACCTDTRHKPILDRNFERESGNAL